MYKNYLYSVADDLRKKKKNKSRNKAASDNKFGHAKFGKRKQS